MQEYKKVYPGGHAPARWLGWLVLILSFLVILPGFFHREGTNSTITPVPTQTPVPLQEQFDETMETCRWSLPEINWYALQLGAFEQADSAQALAEQFVGRGAAGYLWQDDRYRVLAAIYASETDARNVRQQLSQQHGVDSYLYRISLPSIDVQISGMRGQIEILQAAFLHAADLITSLQEISLKSDRSEMGREELAAAAASLQQQTELVRLRLYQRFPEPRNGTVAGLIRLFEDYAAYAAALPADEAEVLLGAKLKYQTIRSLDLLKQVYDTLGNT